MSQPGQNLFIWLPSILKWPGAKIELNGVASRRAVAQINLERRSLIFLGMVSIHKRAFLNRPVNKKSVYVARTLHVLYELGFGASNFSVLAIFG